MFRPDAEVELRSSTGGVVPIIGVVTAVSTAIVGMTAVLPVPRPAGAEAVVMAPVSAGAAQPLAFGERLPTVAAPQPYEPEGPRQVLGPEPLHFPPPEPAEVAVPEPVLNTPGAGVIPGAVLAAYQAAARQLAQESPTCHLTWPLLAGIGRIESGHARGGDVDATGTTRTPIRGPALTGEGNFALIRDSDDGRLDGDTVYDRAVGPMQFLPGTWRGLGRDGNGDGEADPNNIYDAALAAGGYLCLGGSNLLDRESLLAAVFRYNRSWEYVAHVLGWASAYAGVGLPGLIGPSVPASDAGEAEKNKKNKGGKKNKNDKNRDGDDPKPAPGAEPAPTPTPSPSPGISPSPTPSPSPSPTPTPAPSPSPGPTPTPTPTPGPGDGVGTVTGRAFVDLDVNGIDDPTDPGVAGVQIRISGTTSADEAIDLSVVTDVAGAFSFAALPPGTYVVQIVALPLGASAAGVVSAVGEVNGPAELTGVVVAGADTIEVGFLIDLGG